jgi:hypothetical protein
MRTYGQPEEGKELPPHVKDNYFYRILRCGPVPWLAAVVVLGCTSSTSADEEYYTGLVEVDQEIWEEYFPGQRIMFGITTDGKWTAYVSSSREQDPGGYPMEELTVRVVSVAIGGEETKVCWHTGGQQHCDPPPPP